MNTIKVILLLALIIIGLCNRRHHSVPRHQMPRHSSVSNTAAQSAAVNPEILKNAEHLAETLRRCKQTAQNNRETQ